MPEFYYQIKGKTGEPGFSNWSFPPIVSDKVEAKDRKEAKQLIEELYGRKFPTRILQKDLESNEFLLWIKELKEDDHHTRKMLDEVCVCSGCGTKYRMIEKYQVGNPGGGSAYCSSECRDKHTEIERYQNPFPSKYEETGIHKPVIYKITNKVTGMCYIGKTKQAFTFRWYQHFFQSSKKGTSKFYEMIKSSKVCDWTFEVIEVVVFPEEIKTSDEINKYILFRENENIRKFDSVDNGYNSGYSVAQEEVEYVDPNQVVMGFEDVNQ